MTLKLLLNFSWMLWKNRSASNEKLAIGMLGPTKLFKLRKSLVLQLLLIQKGEAEAEVVTTIVAVPKGAAEAGGEEIPPHHENLGNRREMEEVRVLVVTAVVPRPTEVTALVKARSRVLAGSGRTVAVVRAV